MILSEFTHVVYFATQFVKNASLFPLFCYDITNSSFLLNVIFSFSSNYSLLRLWNYLSSFPWRTRCWSLRFSLSSHIVIHAYIHTLPTYIHTAGLIYLLMPRARSVEQITYGRQSFLRVAWKTSNICYVNTSIGSNKDGLKSVTC